MAVVLDVNILCTTLLDVGEDSRLWKKYGVVIDSMHSIDNWMWENEKAISRANQIASVLDMNHIVVMSLRHSLYKDMGLYIEKVKNRFLYSFWINTEGYKMFDGGKVTEDNGTFFETLVSNLMEIAGTEVNSFEVIGIGLETVFCYHENVMDMIHNSRNVMMWIINNGHKVKEQIDGFECYMVGKICVLKKMKE